MRKQAIGGIEGEIRVCLQYLFQAWGCRGPAKYRDLLLETGTEEIGHIEMLATAVALTLEGASTETKSNMAMHPIVGAVLEGMNPRRILSSGLNAMAADANGVPFDGSWVVASGNVAADMYANAMAGSTGRVLATRLYDMTDDPGMKDMLTFLIARDTMHQNQWFAVIEDLGGSAALPIPNSFPQAQENQDFNYTFVSTKRDPEPNPMQRWTSGSSIDGRSQFKFAPAKPLGGVPILKATEPHSHAQVEQMAGRTSIT